MTEPTRIAESHWKRSVRPRFFQKNRSVQADPFFRPVFPDPFFHADLEAAVNREVE
jgi:hypothetical protein